MKGIFIVFDSRAHKLVYFMLRFFREDVHKISYEDLQETIYIFEKINPTIIQYHPSIIDNSIHSYEFLDDIDYLDNWKYLEVTSCSREDENLFDYFINIVNKEEVLRKLSGKFPDIDEFLEDKSLSEYLKSGDSYENFELN